MEFLFISPLLAIFFTLICVVFVYNNRKSTDGAAKLPPGSMGWPIIGETLEFLYGDHDKFVGDRMKKHSAGIFKTRILGEPTVVICGPEGNKFIFANEQKLFTYWLPTSMRKLLVSAHQATGARPVVMSSQSTQVKITRSPAALLNPEALVQYLPKMESIIQEHLRVYWEGKDEVKVYPLAKKLTLTMASQFLLGINDWNRIAELVNNFDEITMGLHSIPLNFPGMVFYRANKSARAVRKVLQQIIKDKKASMAIGGMQDVLSHLIAAADPTGNQLLPEVEIANAIMGFLIAGYSTVATTLTFVMKHIGERHEILKNILIEQTEIMKPKKSGEGLDWGDVQKMKYSWSIVYEVMRLTPSIQVGFREAITDFTYEGFTIPKGWKICWTHSSTNKNPKYFADPERFDPSRHGERINGGAAPDYTFVPFGRGAHMCAGREYARLAILIFLHNVVMKFKWETMSPNEKIIGAYMPTPLQGLPIRLRHHSS